MLIKDSAICIRATDYSETSQIVTFFTRDTGKIGAIAKGSKRPKSSFAGPLEIFSHGKIVFFKPSESKLCTLTEFEQAVGFGNLQRDLFTMNCSFFAAELITEMTTEYDRHTILFDSFLQFLGDLADSDDRCQSLALLIIFQLTLLREAGLLPILKSCANCKNDFTINWPQVYFCSSANGLICRDCEQNFQDRIRLTTEAAGCLADLKKITNSDKKTLTEIEKILTYHFTELLQKKPRMAKYILAEKF